MFLNPKSSILNSRGGQVIIEAIVALSVLTIGYLAILALLNKYLAQSTLISDQNIAIYLASEGLEVTRNLIDANKIQGLPFNDNFPIGSYEISFDTQLDASNPGDYIGPPGTLSDIPLLFDVASGRYNYSIGAPTRFYRTIQISQPNVNQLHAIAIVNWENKGGGNSEVKLEESFFAP